MLSRRALLTGAAALVAAPLAPAPRTINVCFEGPSRSSNVEGDLTWASSLYEGDHVHYSIAGVAAYAAAYERFSRCPAAQ